MNHTIKKWSLSNPAQLLGSIKCSYSRHKWKSEQWFYWLLLSLTDRLPTEGFRDLSLPWLVLSLYQLQKVPHCHYLEHSFHLLIWGSGKHWLGTKKHFRMCDFQIHNRSEANNINYMARFKNDIDLSLICCICLYPTYNLTDASQNHSYESHEFHVLAPRNWFKFQTNIAHFLSKHNNPDENNIRWNEKGKIQDGKSGIEFKLCNLYCCWLSLFLIRVTR